MKNINWTAIAVGFAPVVLQILVWGIGLLIVMALPILIPVAIIILIMLPSKKKTS